MKYFFLFSFFLFSHLLIAQHHDNNWMFGYENAGPGYKPNSEFGGVRMSFDKGYPEFSLENINTHYGVYGGACSDSSGKLIFYTNGFNIRNAKYQLMQNGDTLNADFHWYDKHNIPIGYPSITGSVAIPAPGYNNCYYLFHTTTAAGQGPPHFPILNHSFIDMKANNGLGKVVWKNRVLAEGDIPFPVLIKHGNGRDWWLLAPDLAINTCRTYLVDPKGITRLMDQDIMKPIMSKSHEYSYVDVAPDGSQIAYNDPELGLCLFDFDRCNGLLSNLVNISYAPPKFFTSTVEYSNNGRFLYLGTNRVVYQLDLENIDTSAFVALDTVAQFNFGSSPYPPFYLSFLLPQMAPDGKIYYITFNATKAYHVVNRPEMPGLLCDFAQGGLPIPRFRDGTWNYFPEYRLGKLKGSACDTLGFAPSDVSFRHTVPKNTNHKNQVKTLRLHPDFLAQAAKTNKGVPDDINELDPWQLTQQAILNAQKKKKHE